RRETPRHHDASTSRRSTAANATAKGRTANGRLYRTEPTSSPAKLNGRSLPVSASEALPSGLCGPTATRAQKPSTGGGSTRGRATTASTRNLKRQREAASQ